MANQEHCIGHVDTTGWARNQARPKESTNIPVYEELREYVSDDRFNGGTEIEQARLEQARMPLGQLVSVQLPAVRPEVA